MCFLSAWQRRIYGIPFFAPLWSWRDLAALFVSVMLLAGGFYLLLAFAERRTLRGYPWHGLIYAIPLFAIMNLVRRSAFPFHHGRSTVLVMAAVFVGFVLCLVFGHTRFLRPAEFVILGLLAALPLNMSQMARVIRSSGSPRQLARKLSGQVPPGRRVVWLVFDEMDYSLSFPRRPADIHLPEFERLRSQSLFATAAHQPGPGTEVAMPALLMGRAVEHAQATGTRTLWVRVSPEDPGADLAATDNVFTDVREAGMNVGVLGWYLPYCRMFASVLSECDWESMYSIVSDHPGFWTSVEDQFDALTPLESRVREIQRVNKMIALAKRMAVDPDLSMILIHLPVPHGPPIYDRKSGHTTPSDLRRDWFFDNLLLTDQVLGEIRRAMEDAKQWDNSVVIVTSDHSLRQFMMPHPHATPLVPFIVRMPGQTTGTIFNVPFNTVITRQLIGAIIRGQITSVTLPEWLCQHRGGPDDMAR